MNRELFNILGGYVFITMGLVFALFHKKLGQGTSDFYYKLLHIRFTEKGYQVGFFLCGITFVVVGLLSLFKIIRFGK